MYVESNTDTDTCRLSDMFSIRNVGERNFSKKI